jgi:cytoplasmic iron level regulating protein YaaA (DUF328/UPF0246 family)
MLVTISPAKALNWDSQDGVAMTDLQFPNEALELAQVSHDLSIDELRKLMHISEDLARLNADRFAAYSDTPDMDAIRPAALAFNGDTYQGLEFKTLGDDAVKYAQNHLRILSGLYGILRPLDGMQPYRLEMGSRLKTKYGATLYGYWGTRIAEALNAQAEEVGAATLVNCASQEYFKAVDKKTLNINIVTPKFLENKDGRSRMVSFYAKRARGAMARFVIENRVSNLDGLKEFDSGGYVFEPSESDEKTLTFMRPYPN